jgi:hypothetical protein
MLPKGLDVPRFPKSGRGIKGKMGVQEKTGWRKGASHILQDDE